jgi:hypothetical protein
VRSLKLLIQIVYCLATSTVVCERGFSKQNWVKSKKRTCLNLDTLDTLMRVSLNKLRVEFMDWNGIFDTWKTATITNKRRALSLQEVGVRWLSLHYFIVLEACTMQIMHNFNISFIFL